MHSSHAIGAWLLAGAIATLSPLAGAQTFNDITVTVQGDDVVAHVGFTGSVRLVQQTPLSPAKFYQLQIELLTPDEASLKQLTAESRRVAATASLSEFSLVLNATPNKRMRQVNLQLGEATQLRARQGANPQTIDLVFIGKGVPKPAVQASEQRFAITLASGPSKKMDDLASIPKSFQSFEVFNSSSVQGGVEAFEVNLGYFATADEAQAARQSLLARFPKAKVVDVSLRRAETLKLASAQLDEKPAALPAPAAPQVQAVPVPPAASVLASPEVEARATELMALAKAGVSKGNTDSAIGQLNQLLLLPPNSVTQDAQEMIGLAWERSGNLSRAKMEYELYLKLFDTGEGAQRVAQRLASMGVAPAKAETTLQGAKPAAPKGSETKFTGNLAQYYFGGKTRSQSLVSLDAGIDQSTLTKTTESALVTNVDLGARYTTDDSDVRAVLRGTGSTNLSATSKNTSILNAAYVDYRDKGTGLAMRVGRQSAINGGLLGMFDGVSLTYPVRPGIRVNVMGGVPANPLVSAPAERLFAGMVEADSITENLSGDMYILNQTTEGITNRRAIGTEARYSDERGSMYALLDYDQLFRAVNAITLQGSMQGPGQTTYTLLLDSRKAPSLQLTNALISTGVASLKTLLLTQTLDDVVGAARATTAQARQVLFSVSKPLGEKWQATGDVRFSDIGALPAVGNFEATPATGAQYGVSMQLTGSNLYSKRDINNFNLSLLSTPTFHGAQVAYNNLTGFDENKFTLEPSLRLYVQKDTAGAKMMRVTPGVRSSYNVSKRTSVMGEAMLEHSTNQGPTNHDTTNSVFFYFGVRYELF